MLVYCKKEVIGTYVKIVILVIKETQEELVMLMQISVKIVVLLMDLLVQHVLQVNILNV